MTLEGKIRSLVNSGENLDDDTMGEKRKKVIRFLYKRARR